MNAQTDAGIMSTNFRRGEGDADQGDEATRAAAAAAKKHQKHASAWQSAKPKKEKKEKTQFKTYEEIVAESGSALEDRQELLVDLNGQAVSTPPFSLAICTARLVNARADAPNSLTAPESIAVLAPGVRCRLCRSDSPPRTPTQPHPPLLDSVLVAPRPGERRRRRRTTARLPRQGREPRPRPRRGAGTQNLQDARGARVCRARPHERGRGDGVVAHARVASGR
mgnify:CR=1 FL=1|jgi:hypothetical protein